MLRFITYALPVLLLLLALFGFTVELLDAEPRQGSVIRLALFDTPAIPAPVVLGAWLMEASGLLALFLLARGRCGAWWLDGLVTGWLAWIFRGPLLVITLVVAARQPQHPWWTLVFGWWILYSICGLFLAHLARRSNLDDDDVEESDREASEESDREGPKAAVGPYLSPEVVSSPNLSAENSAEDSAENSTATESEADDALPTEMPPEEPAVAPDEDTRDRPKQGESGPKPTAEET